jgi:hypothetical protein
MTVARCDMERKSVTWCMGCARLKEWRLICTPDGAGR